MGGEPTENEPPQLQGWSMNELRSSKGGVAQLAGAQRGEPEQHVALDIVSGVT